VTGSLGSFLAGVYPLNINVHHNQLNALGSSIVDASGATHTRP